MLLTPTPDFSRFNMTCAGRNVLWPLYRATFPFFPFTSPSVTPFVLPGKGKRWDLELDDFRAGVELAWQGALSGQRSFLRRL